jgi:hypothetical protein
LFNRLVNVYHLCIGHLLVLFRVITSLLLLVTHGSVFTQNHYFVSEVEVGSE